MDTVMDMDTLMVPYTEVMDLEDMVSLGLTFLKATLLDSESLHLITVRWEDSPF